MGPEMAAQAVDLTTYKAPSLRFRVQALTSAASAGYYEWIDEKARQ